MIGIEAGELPPRDVDLAQRREEARRRDAFGELVHRLHDRLERIGPDLLSGLGRVAFKALTEAEEEEIVDLMQRRDTAEVNLGNVDMMPHTLEHPSRVLDRLRDFRVDRCAEDLGQHQADLEPRARCVDQ